VTAEDIQEHLGLGRHKLIALALFLGCDFGDGVPGVGIVSATKFLESVPDAEVLDRWGTAVV
jgi:5'-3' exonuclease